jgi:RecB family exonuclease
LLLTRPYLADDGETWEPSPYWEASRALFDAPPPRRVRVEDAPELADAASRTELLQAAVAHPQLPDGLNFLRSDWDGVQARAEILNARLARETKGIYEGDASALRTLLETRYGPAHAVSPSRLETFGACGFYFFIANALELELVEPPAAGYDARQLGILLHTILERVFGTTPPPQDLDALLETLRRVGPPVLEDAPAALGFRPTALWTHERAAILADLTATVQALHEYGENFRPVETETRFASVILHTSAGDIPIRGTIDRLDANDAGDLRIIDYKTGSSGLDQSAFERGERLQLALYALAAQQRRPDARVVEGFYWHIRGAKPGSFKLSRFDHTDAEGRHYSGPSGAMALALEHTGNFIALIRRGAFTPAPPEDGCPSYCPAKNFCWHFSPSRR